MDLSGLLGTDSQDLSLSGDELSLLAAVADVPAEKGQESKKGLHKKRTGDGDGRAA